MTPHTHENGFPSEIFSPTSIHSGGGSRVPIGCELLENVFLSSIATYYCCGMFPAPMVTASLDSTPKNPQIYSNGEQKIYSQD